MLRLISLGVMATLLGQSVGNTQAITPCGYERVYNYTVHWQYGNPVDGSVTMVTTPSVANCYIGFKQTVSFTAGVGSMPVTVTKGIILGTFTFTRAGATVPMNTAVIQFNSPAAPLVLTPDSPGLVIT